MGAATVPLAASAQHKKNRVRMRESSERKRSAPSIEKGTNTQARRHLTRVALGIGVSIVACSSLQGCGGGGSEGSASLETVTFTAPGVVVTPPAVVVTPPIVAVVDPVYVAPVVVPVVVPVTPPVITFTDYNPPVMSIALSDASGATLLPDPASLRIFVTADEPLSAINGLQMTDASGASVPASIVSTAANQAEIKPQRLLPAGTTFSVTFRAVDLSGNTAAPSFSFSTIGAKAPTFTSGAIPAAAAVTTKYVCLDATDSVNQKCIAEPYKATAYEIGAILAPNFSTSYSGTSDKNGVNRTSLLQCKDSAQCAVDSAQTKSFGEARRVREASSAVVKLSIPYEDYTHLAPYYANSCTGTVVKNNMDSALYIVTAAHCLFRDEAATMSTLLWGTFRVRQMAIAATFFYERATCAAALDPNSFARFGSLTLNAYPLALNVAPQVDVVTQVRSWYGEVTDFALLRLEGPLPSGVTPVAVSSAALTASERGWAMSHPFGVDKSGGPFSGTASSNSGPTNSGYQYVAWSAKRLVESGSSGSALLAYDPAADAVSLKGVLTIDNPPANNNCSAVEHAIYSRIDRHKPFLAKYIGAH